MLDLIINELLFNDSFCDQFIISDHACEFSPRILRDILSSFWISNIWNTDNRYEGDFAYLAN